MAIVNLASIYAKIRRLTGSNDVLQLPNEASAGDPNSVGLADYVNSFYLYDLPAQFRSLKLKDKYTFVTTRGIDTYLFNSERYTTVEMPCYCAKREIKLFQDPWSFYGVNYNWQFQQNITQGDGTPGPYSGTLQATPIIRSVNNVPTYQGTKNVPGVSQGNPAFPAGRNMNLLITANVSLGITENVTDNGNGTLIDPDTGVTRGSIDYDTGAISVTFSQNIPSGENIQVQYNPVSTGQMNIPLSILYFQSQFVLRPVPDKGYTIELTAYRQPTQALMSQSEGANAGTPELSEWWELIAIGAAKKIYEDRLDFDGVALMDKMLQERYQVAYTRTYAQLGKQRTATIFSDQLSHDYGANGWGFSGGSM